MSPNISIFRFTLGSFRELLYLQCYLGGSQVRLALALITPVAWFTSHGGQKLVGHGSVTTCRCEHQGSSFASATVLFDLGDLQTWGRSDLGFQWFWDDLSSALDSWKQSKTIWLDFLFVVATFRSECRTEDPWHQGAGKCRLLTIGSDFEWTRAECILAMCI